MLMQGIEREDDALSERVVVPVERRKGILKMAHSNKLGGHFSYKKTNSPGQTVYLDHTNA